MKYFLVVLALIISLCPAHSASSSAEIPRYRLLITLERGDVWSPDGVPERFSFSPDGTQIAAAASNTTVNIWDIQTGEVVRTFADEGISRPLTASWSPAGRLLAVGSIDFWQTQIWEIASGSLLSDYGPYQGYSTAWSPDGDRFVTEYRIVYDAQNGAQLYWFDSPYPEGCQTYWSPDGSMVATTTCHDADYLMIWSVADGSLIDTYWGGQSAAWSPDSTRIASDAQVREIATGLPVMIIPEMSGDIAWHPNGNWIASTGENEVYIWDAVTGEQLTSWEFQDCSPDSFAWSSDGNRFAVNCKQTDPEIRNDLIIWERVP